MSDSNNEVERYDWKSAWKLDDPEWVKERKKKWREVKSHYIMYIFDGKSKKYIQNYILFGTAFPNGDIDSYSRFDEYLNPLPVKASLLMRIWLHPVNDDTAFSFFKECASQESKSDSLWKFRECLEKAYPNAGGMFGDRDNVIYRSLGPCRGRMIDMPNKKNEQEYRVSCSYRVFYMSLPISNFLTNPYSSLSLAPELMQEWKDMVTPAFYQCCDQGGSSRACIVSMLVDFVKPSIKIIKSPDKYHSKQLEVAQEIINHLKTLDYPDKTKRLTDLLAKV